MQDSLPSESVHRQELDQGTVQEAQDPSRRATGDLDGQGNVWLLQKASPFLTPQN